MRCALRVVSGVCVMDVVRCALSVARCVLCVVCVVCLVHDSCARRALCVLCCVRCALCVLCCVYVV